jgi:hypothetical protein
MIGFATWKVRLPPLIITSHMVLTARSLGETSLPLKPHRITWRKLRNETFVMKCASFLFLVAYYVFLRDKLCHECLPLLQLRCGRCTTIRGLQWKSNQLAVSLLGKCYCIKQWSCDANVTDDGTFVVGNIQYIHKDIIIHEQPVRKLSFTPRSKNVLSVKLSVALQSFC